MKAWKGRRPLRQEILQFAARHGLGGQILADGSHTLSRLIGRPTEVMRDVVLRALRGPVN